MKKQVQPKNEEIKKEKIDNIPDLENLDTVSPKYHYANMIRELFKKDQEIKMSFDNDTCIINMEVDNEIKALAIRRLLPEKKEFSEDDESITINVILRKNRFGGDTYLKDTIYEAFKGNPLFDYQYWWENKEKQTNPYCWVVMNSEPIFYPEANLHNIWGDSVSLPETLATEILTETTDKIYYCSDNPEREMPDHNTRKFNE